MYIVQEKENPTLNIDTLKNAATPKEMFDDWFRLLLLKISFLFVFSVILIV